MPSERPDVTVLLVQRLGSPDARELAAWEEAANAYGGFASISHVWAGTGTVPAGMDLGTPAAAIPVLGLADDAVVVVAESSAVPGPHLLERLVDEVLSSTDRVIDTRVLPVEVTLTDDRPRGYRLSDGTDPSDSVLKEERLSVEGDDEDDDSDDSDDSDDEDLQDVRAVAVPEERQEQRVAGRDADQSVSAHEVRARDGFAVRPRVTGACCAVRARHLLPLVDALVAEPSPTSGAALVTAARGHDLEVDVAVTAAVSLPLRLGWDARPVGRVPAANRAEPEWPAATHPAALGASSLGRIVQQYDLPVGDLGADQTLDDDAPFLSIVTRTQGARIHCLEDVFTCLAGQTDRDFEVLVAAHRVDDHHMGLVRDVVASLPSWLRDRVRVLPVERPGRAAPLNEGFAAARGRYIVALDDDDTVLAHYVATFRTAAQADYGRLVRVVAARQDVAPVGSLDTLCAVSVDDPFREWPMDFALAAHLMSNYSPFMSVAFPRGAFHDLDIRFDESLNTTEDWDYVVRCAATLGVSSVREITCVYRWWVHTGSSREVHTKAEWEEARLRVQRRFEESVLLLLPIETERLVESLDTTRRAANKANRLAREFATSQHHTNLKMIDTAKAYNAAVRKREVAERRVDKLRAELKEAKQRIRRQRARMDHLQAQLDEHAATANSRWRSLLRRP